MITHEPDIFTDENWFLEVIRHYLQLNVLTWFAENKNHHTMIFFLSENIFQYSIFPCPVGTHFTHVLKSFNSSHLSLHLWTCHRHCEHSSHLMLEVSLHFEASPSLVSTEDIFKMLFDAFFLHFKLKKYIVKKNTILPKVVISIISCFRQ